MKISYWSNLYSIWELENNFWTRIKDKMSFIFLVVSQKSAWIISNYWLDWIWLQMIWRGIVSSSTIDKMFESYTFYKNRAQIYTFYENCTKIYTFYKNRTKININILFKNRFEIFEHFVNGRWTHYMLKLEIKSASAEKLNIRKVHGRRFFLVGL